MLKKSAAALLLALACTASSAQARTEAESTQEGSLICVTPVSPQPPAHYVVVKQLKLGKGSYGHVDQAIDMLAAEARKIGADAVINYTGSQRFGFFPWRFVHPVVRGTAVKWQPGSSFNCTASGGSLH